jgi:hypothetical protein
VLVPLAESFRELLTEGYWAFQGTGERTLGVIGSQRGTAVKQRKEDERFLLPWWRGRQRNLWQASGLRARWMSAGWCPPNPSYMPRGQRPYKGVSKPQSTEWQGKSRHLVCLLQSWFMPAVPIYSLKVPLTLGDTHDMVTLISEDPNMRLSSLRLTEGRICWRWEYL